ncbi:serine hydrolase domain-containing protein [Paenibacillus methanolicus]|uniref:CubicO group peptidase (Beta-lactamase class C family) n=1 Tax=Paenibacillus methanolicus TaxID=582686 RepID=A0A5S5C571_9BACL|nr:serine hydrolase domain-containing protein [Paenibacillus methanolicus]TYP73113.1 CubicO group peptidase (beta-lactamase class C family) [Paenibacillus methanolicus]
MQNLQKRMFIAIGCLLLLCSVCTTPISAMEVRDRAKVWRDIDEYMNRNMKANHIEGASLAIANNEEVFYAEGYGTFADGQRVTGDTPFPIASLSKSFTALAVLQLVDKGRIDLDATYASYFPELSPQDPRVRDITIRHLLNQTSGLNDQTNPDMTRNPQFQTLHEAKWLLNEVQLAHDPGTTYSYHNPNYVLLANLVESVSGERFSDYLNQHVFKPLGMDNTFSVGTTRQIDGNDAIPPGHYFILGRSVSHSEPLWFVEGPAGIVSTAEDMSRWMLAQYRGDLLSPALTKQYHSAGAIGPYGMGWLADQEEAGGRTISHSGIFWTYKSEETIYLDDQMGIAVMFNSGLNAFVNYAAFIDGIADIMRGEQPETSFLNGRNMEIILIALILATLVWGVYAYVRIRRKKKRLTIGKLISITIGRLIPILILLSLSPLLTFIGGGRVLPWFGIWTTLPTLILWLAVWSLANVLHLVCYYNLYVQYTKKARLEAGYR